MTTFNDYQAETINTAVYPEAGEGTADALSYVALGLVGEAGEVANQAKKILRDDNGEVTEERKDKLAKEIGDVLWYIARMADELELDLDEVATENLSKLQDRQRNNRLRGSGDDR